MEAKCVWFTGLPCSGKTTLAKQLKLHIPGSVHLDGDVIRNTPLANTTGFTPEERKAHILKMGTIASLITQAGHSVICSFISPEKAVRDRVRSMFKLGQFIEVFCSADLTTCRVRDVKGMYAKAVRGEIKNFTGIDAPYEVPKSPELTLQTGKHVESHCLNVLLNYLKVYPMPACLFIGRWNGIYHNGHDHIIRKKLNEGKTVVMAIRDVKPDEKNPWTAAQVKRMLDHYWGYESRVSTVIIPDIESVEYGRNVGYAVNEIIVEEKIAGISGTECRKLMAAKDSSWKTFVPKRVADYLESYKCPLKL